MHIGSSSKRQYLVNRRAFIKRSIAGSSILTLPIHSFSSQNSSLTFGVIADLHQDIMHDGENRLSVFISEAKVRNPDFIIQMGDFCIPRSQNRPLMDLWNSYQGSKYHVIGNHDMDLGYSRDQTREFWKMDSRYYSFDKNGIHFVVLDGNDPNPEPWTGYNRFIDKEQQAWLKEDLMRTKNPVIVFSHQSLENQDGGIDNLLEVREILENTMFSKNKPKVLACFSGHHHTDYFTRIKGIYYIQLNSASYHWVGGDYSRIRYGTEIDEKYPNIKKTIPYKDPLFTFITVNPSGSIEIEEKITEFVGPGPTEIGMPEQPKNCPIVPRISGNELNLKRG